jgi:hypothetical protein
VKFTVVIYWSLKLMVGLFGFCEGTHQEDLGPLLPSRSGRTRGLLQR